MSSFKRVMAQRNEASNISHVKERGKEGGWGGGRGDGEGIGAQRQVRTYQLLVLRPPSQRNAQHVVTLVNEAVVADPALEQRAQPWLPPGFVARLIESQRDVRALFLGCAQSFSFGSVSQSWNSTHPPGTVALCLAKYIF